MKSGADKGFIYLIYDNSKGYKIGCTKNDPRKRLVQLQVGNINKLTLIHSQVSNTMLETEQHWHKVFKHKRVKGEWFNLTEKEINQFKEYFWYDVGFIVDYIKVAANVSGGYLMLGTGSFVKGMQIRHPLILLK